MKWIPFGVKGLLGFIVLAGAALAVLYSFVPADLEIVVRECRPELVKLEVTNSGGQAATLGDAHFDMVSTARFQDTIPRRMDAHLLDNPIGQHRTIPKGESWSYEWLNVYQPAEVAEGETCHIYINVPLMGEDRTFPADCPCSAH